MIVTTSLEDIISEAIVLRSLALLTEDTACIVHNVVYFGHAASSVRLARLQAQHFDTIIVSARLHNVLRDGFDLSNHIHLIAVQQHLHVL